MGLVQTSVISPRTGLRKCYLISGGMTGCGPSFDRTMTTVVAVTQRLTCSQQHSHYEVEHREPLEAITLTLYIAEVITGQERKSRRLSRSRDF